LNYSRLMDFVSELQRSGYRDISLTNLEREIGLRFGMSDYLVKKISKWLRIYSFIKLIPGTGDLFALIVNPIKAEQIASEVKT